LERVDWAKLIDNLVRQGILRTPKVINVMKAVPRTRFLSPDSRSYDSVDTPLPIGFGQTISAPHMVSIMNEALQLEVGQKVLEVGAGSGWHSATIAEIIAPKGSPRSEWGHVYTIEIVPGLAEFARKNIMNGAYGDRVTIVHADGEFQAAERLAQAAQVISSQPSALQLRYLGTLKEIATERTNLVIFPLPLDIVTPFLSRGSQAKSQETTK
jgi:protein-L-isoaspartate(D-aspartate) O-methyltransferase